MRPSQAFPASALLVAVLLCASLSARTCESARSDADETCPTGYDGSNTNCGSSSGADVDANASADADADIEPRLLPRPNALKLDRQKLRELSYKKFVKKYVKPTKPVVFTDFADVMLSGRKWTFDDFAEGCGDSKMRVRMTVDPEKAWGGLASMDDEYTVRDVLEMMRDPARPMSQRPYIHDQSTAVKCPKMVFNDYFRIPGLFNTDLKNALRPHHFPDNQQPISGTWPSFFIGTKGTGTHFHVDNLATAAWTALLEGRKSWKICPGKEDGNLYRDSTSTAMNKPYRVNPFRPDYDLHPRYRVARCWETILHAGEGLYLPPNLAHAVENIDNTIMLSANYVDKHNLKEHLVVADQQLRDEPPSDRGVVAYNMFKYLVENKKDFGSDFFSRKKHIPLTDYFRGGIYVPEDKYEVEGKWMEEIEEVREVLKKFAKTKAARKMIKKAYPGLDHTLSK